MKKFLALTMIALMLLSFSACGGGLADDPIEVRSAVKVGMTEIQIREVVDLEHFQDNKSYLMVMVSDVQILDKGFRYTTSESVNSPYYAELFFSTVTNIDVCLVISRWSDSSVIAIGVIPFADAKELAEDYETPLWRLRQVR